LGKEAWETFDCSRIAPVLLPTMRVELKSEQRWQRLGILLLLTLAQSCYKPPENPPPPPANVTVSYPLEHEVIQWDEYSGYFVSPDMSNVEARVSGLITQALFKEGALVHKGDELFEIDDRPFKADLDSKKADVAKAQAQVDLATATLHRMDKVRNSRAISEEDYDTAQANLEQNKAMLAGAKAALDTAQLNLQWTRVTAPISGRVSRQYVQPGNLVNGGSSQGQATLLTTIVAIDPLYCYINVPERAALRYQEMVAEEKQANVASAHIPCYFQLENETSFPHEGVIDFIDNRIDVNTGTVPIRGVLSNPTGVLTPGLFARMRIPGSGRYKALLIPDVAIGTEQNERFVLVLGLDDVVRSQPVKLGVPFGTLRSIVSGLKPGERVVVNGLQQARPGTKVNPHEAPVSTAELEALAKTLPASPATQSIPLTSPTTEATAERKQ
jgi:RND family efflux transporter MFP subunit